MGKDEKKNAIFGDWSEDENEEIEEKVKLQESINDIVADHSDESDEEFFSFKTNKQLEEEKQKIELKRPLRERKKSVEKSKPNKGKKKVKKKKQSVSDAVKSLINTSLREDDLEADESSGNDDNDEYDDHFDDHDDLASPPPSPPPTTPSKKPVILKKSSSRSFQLPSRPDGKLELIKHDSSETKFAGISAKAKAKQLARSQISNNELFDKLLETDASSKKESLQKRTERVMCLKKK